MKRAAIQIGVITGVLVQAAPEPGRAENAPPNIVFILADDLGWGDLSCYGAADVRTPNIDRLAETGVRFTGAYANCPVCSPTRAALLTGREPDLVGVPGVIRTHADDSWGYLSPDAVLLPGALGAAGYDTALIGKWHLGLGEENHPLRRGFAVFRGFLGDMMDDYETHLRHGIKYMRDGFEVIEPEGHATDLFTEWAVEQIGEQAGGDRPFFLYVAYNAPHSPIQPPDEWLDRVMQRDPGLGQKRARIVALIEHMDAGVGSIVAALREHGVDQNTLVVFTSDNGGDLACAASNGPLRAGKGQMYEGGIRVPQIVAWPGRVRPGSETDAVMLTMDWYPTLCAAAGIGPPREVDGVNMLPVLTEENGDRGERTHFWMRREGGDAFMGLTAWAVRAGDWKLLQPLPTAPFELYNLAEDPTESRDLREAERGVFRDLAQRLRKRIQKAGRVPWQPPPEPR